MHKYKRLSMRLRDVAYAHNLKCAYNLIDELIGVVIQKHERHRLVKAARNGDINSQYALGISNITENRKRRTIDNYWLEQAAQGGHATAQFCLGIYHETGLCRCDKDDKAAFYWYKKAALQGDSDGQYHLGLCYENGIGTEVNRAFARKWYRKAIKQGNRFAELQLQRMLQCDQERNNP